MDPLDDLRLLYPDGVFVEHEPKSESYWRAETALFGIVTEGCAIGFGLDLEHETPRRILVIWVEPLNNGDFGEYATFKFLEDEFGPYRAILFSYYDGFEGRPGFKSRFAAINFMKQNYPDYQEFKTQ